MGDTRGFRTHEGILADVLVTVWILSIGMAVVAAMGHCEVVNNTTIEWAEYPEELMVDAK